MKLNLYRRHRPGCEAGRRKDSKSSELEQRRKGWSRRCQCQIHVSGTLDGRFSRKATSTSNWVEAHRITTAYENADSWTGKPKAEPVAADSRPAKSRLTLAEACQVFMTSRESAGLAAPSRLPEINQTFFIGNGLTGTGSGATQRFHVPLGAPTLYLGLVDGFDYGRFPGPYNDNTGAYQVTLDVATPVGESQRWLCSCSAELESR